MENIKYISIFKVTEKKSENAPDYTLSINVGTTEAPKYVECGAGWIKQGNNTKFISCKLSDPYADHTKGTKRDGFHLAVDEIKGTANTYPVDTDEPDINIEDIPF